MLDQTRTLNGKNSMSLCPHNIIALAMVGAATISQCSENLSDFEVMVLKLVLIPVLIERGNSPNSLFQHAFLAYTPVMLTTWGRCFREIT
jgi:hypothetical protein